jgi:hypothetical protein
MRTVDGGESTLRSEVEHRVNVNPPKHQRQREPQVPEGQVTSLQSCLQILKVLSREPGCCSGKVVDRTSLTPRSVPAPCKNWMVAQRALGIFHLLLVTSESNAGLFILLA